MCHESFQNAFRCYRFSAKIEKTLPLQVTAREVMIFFWKSAPLGAASRDFRRLWPRKVVISKKIKRSLPFSLSLVVLLDINWNRFQDWCVAKFVQLISCAGRQKSLGNTALEFNLSDLKHALDDFGELSFSHKIKPLKQKLPSTNVVLI